MYAVTPRMDILTWFPGRMEELTRRHVSHFVWTLNTRFKWYLFIYPTPISLTYPAIHPYRHFLICLFIFKKALKCRAIYSLENKWFTCVRVHFNNSQSLEQICRSLLTLDCELSRRLSHSPGIPGKIFEFQITRTANPKCKSPSFLRG